MTTDDGRPGRVNVSLSAEEMRRLDEWRRAQPDLPNRSEAVRRLMEIGLATHARKRGAGR